MRSTLKLECDPTNVGDLESAIATLEAQRDLLRRVGPLSEPMSPATDVALPAPARRAELERLVRRMLVRPTGNRYGSTRRSALRRIAEASPGLVDAAELRALLPHGRSLNGLTTSLVRKWSGIRGTALVERFVFRRAGAYGMDPEVAEIVLVILDELEGEDG